MKRMNVKQVKGVEFECSTCGTSLSFVLSTQQTYINECPNCGKEWLPTQLQIEALRTFKNALKIFSNSESASISLICEENE